MKDLLKAGGDVNTIDSKGFSALMRAAQNDHYKCVNYLASNQTDLKGQCRKVIREYLLNNKPRLKLHISVPKLGLPSPLASYLLYYTKVSICNMNSSGP